MREEVHSSEHFRRLVESVKDYAILTLDPSGHITTWNPGAEHILGYPATEIVGRHCSCLYTPEDVERGVPELALKQAATKGCAVDERWHVRKDGARFWSACNITPLLDDAGQFQGFAKVIRDVTERKKAQDSLRQSHRQYETLVNSVSGIVWEADADTFQFILVSKQAEVILGYPTEQWLSEPDFWVKHIHPEDREWTVAFCARAAAERRPHQFDYRMIAKDGSVVWLRDIVNVVTEDDRSVKLRGIMTDITERKRQYAALEDSERRFKALFNNALNAILLADDEARYVDANPAACELLGYTREELLRLGIWDVTPAAEQAPSKELWSRFIEYGKTNGEYKLQRKDGTTIDIEYSSVANVMPGLHMSINHDITERKRAELTLRESEGKFRRLMEQAADGIFITDRNGFCLDVNPKGCDMLGYRKDELLQLNVRDIIPTEDQKNVPIRFDELRSGNPLVTERQLQCKNGSLFPTETNAKALDDGNIQFIVRDIRKRKEDEADKARLIAILEATTDLIGIADIEGRTIYHNRALREAVGMGETADMTETVINDYHPAWVHKLFAEVSIPTAIREGSWEGETALNGKDGGEIPLSQVIIAHKNYEGEVEFLSTIGRDISERKRAEEALRESEEKYRRIVETANEGIWTIDTEGTINFVNRQAADLLGYTVEEMIGRKAFDFLNDADQAEAQTRFEARERGYSAQAEFRARRKDGSTIHILTSSTAIRNKAGETTGLLGMLIDISEVKNLEEQLRHSQKMEAVGQLAGGIAHDFNNMLTAINGYSDLLLRQLETDNPMRHKIEEIRKAGTRAGTLTAQLLAFSRKQILQPKVLDLNEIISDTDKMLQRMIGEDIELITVLRPALGSVKTDPGQITQVLVNLVVNARDAMPHGGKLTIETDKLRLKDGHQEHGTDLDPGSYVTLTVSDTGTGMDEETMQHIFEPFFTTKDVGKGTGMGLATVYGIVKQSGGNIRVRSEVGRGSTFTIYLPLIHEVESAVSESADSAAFDLPRGTETILLVEDEEIVRTMTCQILEMCGYTVIEAGNGAEAIRLCEQDGCDAHLVLTDVVMPQMSGRELIHNLSRMHPHLKVLFTSGYTDDAIVHHGVLDVDTNFIQKPFTPDALANKVREVLDAER